jgi:predicted esterase YcpF (UPF0227 family)
MPTILYLHGFRSSPQSFKARMIGDRLTALDWAGRYACPQLPASPREAIELASQIASESAPEDLALVGSSLGGYYATWLAERIGCRAVLLNPAVKPPRDLERYVGVTTAFHSNERFEFRHEYIDELKSLEVETITLPERYFLLAATGDEVLDWREMVAHYPRARHRVINGSDHGISEFAQYVDEVLAFSGVQTEQAPREGQP